MRSIYIRPTPARAALVVLAVFLTGSALTYLVWALANGVVG